MVEQLSPEYKARIEEATNRLARQDLPLLHIGEPKFENVENGRFTNPGASEKHTFKVYYVYVCSKVALASEALESFLSWGWPYLPL